ncbi:MAG: hypothetical protein KDD61_08250 [Bdellovibrionales bacterium]|nr:hypothetical protein [Bdellovibrionales bacterium]
MDREKHMKFLNVQTLVSPFIGLLVAGSAFATEKNIEYRTEGCIAIDGEFYSYGAQELNNFKVFEKVCVGDEIWFPTSGPRSGEFAVNVVGIDSSNMYLNYNYQPIIPLTHLWENDYWKYAFYKPKPGEVLPRTLRKEKERRQEETQRYDMIHGSGG